jgi:hypothetical protein
MTSRIPVYAAAKLLGILAMLLILPLETLLGGGAGWATPGGDQAQTLSGHLAFQADAWRWPLLHTVRLFWPNGISIALIDSNPLASILAKLWTHAAGTPPVNALGAFLGLCWLMQPVAGVYAARGLRVGPLAALTAGVLAAAWPALMVRMGHINLCAHFLMLLALGLAFRRLTDAPPTLRRWAAPAALLLAAVLTHPYLFQLCAAVLGAAPLQSALRRRPGWWRDAVGYGLSGVLAVGVLMAISGPIGGGDKGYTFFSMNLLSPIVPQMSGVFGLRPVIDATGGQYEGFNWLGAGTMLLLVATLAMLAWRRTTAPRPALALVLVLAGLTALSLSSQVYAGHVRILNLGVKPWEDIFGSFRSSGRAFWPVGYAVMLGCVAAVDRLNWRLAAPLLLAAVVLQLIDIQPLATDARAFWRNGTGIVAPAVPGGATLFTVAPHPGCAQEPATKQRGPLMLLDAVRHGAMTGDIGLGRSPRWFSCERVLSDALELPLAPHEARAFFGAAAQAALRPDLLGASATCWMVQDVALCGRDVTTRGGAPIPAASPPSLTLPATLEGAAITPLLGSGWKPGATAEIWSEGPRGTLLIPVTPGRAVTLRLRAAGIAYTAGEPRTVAVSFGRIAGPDITLPDGMAVQVLLHAPAEATESGMLRVALDVSRPVDPARRGLTAPVKRAAIRLLGVAVEQ